MTSYPDKSTAKWVLGLASGTGVLVALDTLIVSTALTTIRRQLGASVADLEWTVNAYVLSFAVLLMTGAALGDRFGRKRMFASGLALFAVASAACALSDSAGWLIAARALQGAGAALMSPLALALLSAAFPPQARAKALGIFGGVVAFGIVLGPLVGGAVVEGISWRYAFWINVPIGLALMVLAIRRVPESRGPDPSIDLPGLALVTGAAFGIVWALVRGNSVGWGSPEVVVSLAAGVLLAGAFVGWELRVSKPMLPIRLFRARPFASGNTSGFFFWGAVLGRGQRTAGGRAPSHALGGGDVLRRAGRRFANSALWREAVHRRGSLHPGCLAGLPGPDRQAGPSVRRVRRPAGPSRIWSRVVPPRNAERRDEPRRSSKHRQGLGDLHNSPPAGRRSGSRGVGRDLQCRGQLCVASGVQRRVRSSNGSRGRPGIRWSDRRLVRTQRTHAARASAARPNSKAGRKPDPVREGLIPPNRPDLVPTH